MICDGYKNAESGSACCNQQPTPMSITLQATVKQLLPGAKYNLYEYIFDGIAGVGADAALKVPIENFNANSNMASYVTKFVADGSGEFLHYVKRSSADIVVFRCVEATAP